jgi:hypothetical protein
MAAGANGRPGAATSAQRSGPHTTDADVQGGVTPTPAMLDQQKATVGAAVLARAADRQRIDA